MDGGFGEMRITDFMALDTRLSTINDATPAAKGAATLTGEERRLRGDFSLSAAPLPGSKKEMEVEWVNFMLEDRPQYSLGTRFQNFGNGLELVIPEYYLCPVVDTAHLKAA